MRIPFLMILLMASFACSQSIDPREPEEIEQEIEILSQEIEAIIDIPECETAQDCDAIRFVSSEAPCEFPHTFLAYSLLDINEQELREKTRSREKLIFILNEEVQVTPLGPIYNCRGLSFTNNKPTCECEEGACKVQIECEDE